jgi:hypothetical protein
MKLLTRVVARGQRAQVVEIERQVQRLTEIVDRFYALLGPRHWIFHDRLNVEQAGELIGLDVDAAEEAFIRIYQDPEALSFMIVSLNRFPAMRVRMNLIEKARVDYIDGRFYSTVLVLLAVMDGFVNELDSARRRGLHARGAEELQARDSVVGHHLGLAHAHKTFTKRTLKTSTDPVFELHRNGIMHGTLLDYDNVIVATKAWNRLFAVADWATSLERRAVDPKPAPSWRELFQQINRNQQAKEALDEWRPTTLLGDGPQIAGDETCQRANAYLEAWQAKNYGTMGVLISPMFSEGTPAKTAGAVRAEFEDWGLERFTITRAVFEAAAVCEIEVDLIFADRTRPAQMRWIREAEDGMAAMPNEPGVWYLYSWGPWAMFNRRESGEIG